MQYKYTLRVFEFDVICKESKAAISNKKYAATATETATIW